MSHGYYCCCRCCCSSTTTILRLINVGWWCNLLRQRTQTNRTHQNEKVSFSFLIQVRSHKQADFTSHFSFCIELCSIPNIIVVAWLLSLAIKCIGFSDRCVHFEYDCETLLGRLVASKTPAVCKRKQKISSIWLRQCHCSNQSHWIVRYFWRFRMHYIKLLTNAWFVCVLYNRCRCCISTDVQKLCSHFVGDQRWRKNMNRYDTTCVTCFSNRKQHLRNALHGNWWQMLCWKHTRSSS